MSDFRTEADSLGRVEVPAEKLWGAQTQRSLQHFSIGQDLIPREMIVAYAVIKRAAATANHNGGRLPDQAYALITRVCDEILGDRLCAERHGCGATSLVQRGAHGEIGSRQVEREVVELQPEAVGGTDLVDSSAAGRRKLDKALRGFNGAR